MPTHKPCAPQDDEEAIFYHEFDGLKEVKMKTHKLHSKYTKEPHSEMGMTVEQTNKQHIPHAQGHPGGELYNNTTTW
jgi:hypothetical protein